MAFPSRSPLLPATRRSLRAASVFLTTPPHKAERAWPGTLRLYSASKQTTGGPIRKRTGEPGTAPAPRKTTAPVPGSPDPSFLPPKTTTDPAAQMTGESASTVIRAARRLRNSARAGYRAVFRAGGSCKDRGGTPGNPPKAAGFPVSPHPLPPFPPPEGALRTPGTTRIPRRPGHRRKPARRPAGTPGPRVTRGKQPPDSPPANRVHRKGHSRGTRVPPWPDAGGDSGTSRLRA